MDTESSESLSKRLDSEKNSTEARAPLLNKLDDVVKWTQMINQHLQDLSNERRAELSQMQWATIEEFESSTKANAKQGTFCQKSLFARTYFPDKDLDELFKHVMKYSSKLFTYLNNLNGKVQCKSGIELDTVSTRRISKAEIAVESSRESSASLAVDLPPKLRKTTDSVARGDDEDLDDAIDLRSIRQSFTDLVRTKVDFDSQFLKFNALLSKTTYSEDFHCLYEICAKSNVITEQTSLSIDKCESLAGNNAVSLRRERHRSINDDEGQSHLEKRPRRSKRLADIASQVQIIPSFQHV